MQQISSPSTFVVKWLLPMIYFGVVVLVLVYLLNGVSEHWTSLAVLVAPVFFGVVGYLAMRDRNFQLVDEVWLGDGEIVVHNAGQEESIALENLQYIKVAPGGSTRHVTLFLKTPSVFGDEIKFMQSNDRWPPVEKLLDQAVRESQGDLQ